MPAYWAYQVLFKRLSGAPPQYKLGRTLSEEVGACLLGGYGIPAAVGLAAFDNLRSFGAFSGTVPSYLQLLNWLNQPILVKGKKVRYRFAAQKAKYLSRALEAVQHMPPIHSGLSLREWLLELPGIGYKTASWIARNWLDADDVAILDIHILRFGRVIGLFPSSLTVERNYRELEILFLDLCRSIDIRASELDAVIWHEMANSPRSMRALLSKVK
jgi:hypothetical protein